jgi:hypothetical protein
MQTLDRYYPFRKKREEDVEWKERKAGMLRGENLMRKRKRKLKTHSQFEKKLKTRFGLERERAAFALRN